MQEGQSFVDYYAVLGVDPVCDFAVLEKAYKTLARLYHPDHADTADIDRFHALSEAYAALKDPERRTKYDKLWKATVGDTYGSANVAPGPGTDELAALHDAEVHKAILLRLYKRRRDHADDPGILGFYIQEALDCSDRNFEFHVWYLKAKGLVDYTEDSKLAITIDGVDHVIATSRAAAENPRITSRGAMTD